MQHNYPKSFKELILPIKKELVITVLLAIFGTLSLLIAPVAITLAIDHYLNQGLSGFLFWVIIAGAGLAVKQILHVLSLGYAHVVEAKFRYKLRKDFSDKLSRLPLGFFSETSSGAIRKFVAEDTVKIHTIIAHSFSDVTAGLTLPVGCAVLMLLFEWRTALIILALTLLIIVIGMIWMGANSRRMEDINSRYEVAQREMSHAAIEMVDGIKEIKNFGIGGDLFERFSDALHRFSIVSFEWLSSSSKAISFIMAAIQPTVMLFVALAVCLFSIRQGWLPKAYIILFMLLSIVLPSSLISVMQVGNHVREGKYAVDNLLNLYARADQHFVEKPQKFKLGDIVFDDVSFAYDGQNDVIKNVSCRLARGQLTAFVGASGSGKTTMARLIARFWDVRRGVVSIGGVNVKELSEKDMLANISLVFQDVALIDASIADNIALARPTASRQEIIAAAKAAYIDARISRLPNGYDSIYGAENVVLSGGERQRLTIARAFLADAPIVLLDEATAQADAESEVEIQKALSKLSAHKTVVIIAHRLASIVKANQILVFDDGRIVQSGSHQTLIDSVGLYRQMWLAQHGVEEVK